MSGTFLLKCRVVNINEDKSKEKSSISMPSPQNLTQLPNDVFKYMGPYLDTQSASNLSTVSRRLRAPAQQVLLQNSAEDGISFDLTAENGIPKYTVNDVVSFLRQAKTRSIRNIKLDLVLDYTKDAISHPRQISANELSQILPLCDDVVSLTLYSNELTDAEIQRILNSPHLANLTHLSLPNCGQITSVGMQSISAMPNIKHLELGIVGGVGDIADIKAQLSSLATMKNLSNLDFSTYYFLQMQPQDSLDIADIFSRMTQLTSLSIRRMCIGDDGLNKIANTLKLTNLNLEYNGITDVGINNLANSVLRNTLQNLNLAYNQISDAGLQDLLSLSQLTYLNLDHNQIVTIPDLSSLSNLEFLSLASNYLQSTQIQGLSGAKKLRELNLGNINVALLGGSNQISDSDIRLITQLPNLTTLNLASNKISDLSARAFAQSPKISNLDLSNNTGITLRGIKVIAESHNRFKYLNVIGTDLSERAGSNLYLSELQKRFPFIVFKSPYY